MQRISIVVATYRRPDLLIRTLTNLQEQAYRPLEVVIADDGSPPATQNAVRSWQAIARPDFEMLYLWQENQGPAVARDKGLCASSGDLIVFMDDDDLIHPRALEELAKKYVPGKIPCASYRYWMDGKSRGPAILPGTHFSHEAVRAMIAGRWFVPIHGYLFSREMLEKAGEWDRHLTSQEDDEYLLRIAMAGYDFVAAPEAEVYYCQHTGVRRATPGKPGEDLGEGITRRMHADLAIRQKVFDQLQETYGQKSLLSFVPVFSLWRDRFLDLYEDIIQPDGLTGSLPEWLQQHGLGLEPLRHSAISRKAEPA